MKILLFKRKKLLLASLIFLSCILLLLFIRIPTHRPSVKMVMGGTLNTQKPEDEKESPVNKKPDVETYFRPSNLPVLNDRFSESFFGSILLNDSKKFKLPDQLLKTPQDTILNYFSMLREAANPADDKWTGCGTLGDAHIPYPAAYQFLSTSYQEKLPYDQYLKSFLNILHISLVKYKEVPLYDNPSNILRYFVEIETIQGSDSGIGYFAYYYAFVDLMKENGLYKINNVDFTGENYLCAPYHGWHYDAESSVEIRYGGWCDLIKKMNPTKQKDYVKQVSFQGKDGNDYLILFYQLTNDTDVEIAQYKKDSNEQKWKLTQLDPEKCIKDKQ